MGHLYRCADSERRFAEQRFDGGRNSSHDHRDKLRHGSYRDGWRNGGDERSGVSGTQITATTPAGSAGQWTVTVTNLGAQSGSLASAFTYMASGTPSAPTNLTVAGGGPGPTYVSGQGYYNSTSLTTHTTASFNSTGGDLILLFASSHAGVTFTPSDSLGNTWISITGPTSTVLGFDLRSQVWYAPHPTVGAAQTVTMNLSIAQPLVMSIVVVKGSNGSSPINAISLVGSDIACGISLAEEQNVNQTCQPRGPSNNHTRHKPLLLLRVGCSIACRREYLATGRRVPTARCTASLSAISLVPDARPC